MQLAVLEASGIVEQGGPIVWIQLVLAVLGAIFIVERMFFFHRARVNVSDLLIGLGNHVKKKAFAEARHEAARAPGPVARVAHTILLRADLPRADLRDIAQEAGQLEVPRLERNIRAILGIALLAPLMGMLGTILGLIDVFQKMNERGGFAGPAELSGGVFQSLITTALGLVIAIVMYLFYLYFLGRARRMIHRLERAGIETVNMIVDARIEDFSARAEDAARQGRV
ncbi:MAG: MotA/TolQ/ExbB proton channel family protein [Akkermansiaceae bacterium]|jgi:biopolymer transport protein ExbB